MIMTLIKVLLFLVGMTAIAIWAIGATLFYAAGKLKDTTLEAAHGLYGR